MTIFVAVGIELKEAFAVRCIPSSFSLTGPTPTKLRQDLTKF